MREVTNENEKAIIISYLNDSFDLAETEEAFNDKDKVLKVWQREVSRLHRSFLVYFLYDRQPLVGVFLEWKDSATETIYGKNRFMLMGVDMIDTIKELNLDLVKVLYEAKK